VDRRHQAAKDLSLLSGPEKVPFGKGSRDLLDHLFAGLLQRLPRCLSRGFHGLDLGINLVDPLLALP